MLKGDWVILDNNEHVLPQSDIDNSSNSDTDDSSNSETDINCQSPKNIHIEIKSPKKTIDVTNENNSGYGSTIEIDNNSGYGNEFDIENNSGYGNENNSVYGNENNSVYGSNIDTDNDHDKHNRKKSRKLMAYIFLTGCLYITFIVSLPTICNYLS